MSENNNFKPNLEGYKPLRPFNLFMKNNFPFIENTFEALDTYGLICQLVKYLNTVIENTNTMETNIGLLSNAFNELNDYVAHYFDNLDVQEEIDNKLDDMVESGTLQEIISEYLNSKAVFGFDNVNDMKEATNLIDGSYAQTLGYYNANDGGAALYRITENEPLTYYEVLESGLYAELIKGNIVNIKQYGAKGDNETDNSDIFQIAFNEIDNSILYIDSDTYLLDDTVTLNTKDNFKIICKGLIHAKSSEIHELDVFEFINCNNFEIDGLKITSDLDKTELAPTDHVRESYTGSNRLGIKLSYCKNVVLNNIVTENMCQDIKLNRPNTMDEIVYNENIKINNWQSKNSSMCFLCLFSRYVEVNNSNVNLKEELGDGNHFFYVERYCNHIYFNNIIAKVSDTYIKYGFNIYEGAVQTQPSTPTDIYINNCYMKAPSFLAVQRYSSCYVNDTTFEGFESLAHNSNYFIISIANAISLNLLFNNCNFKNYKTQLFYYYKSSGTHVEFNNCNVEYASGDYSNYMIGTSSDCSNNTIIVKDSVLNIKQLLYVNSSTSNFEIKLLNNLINSTDTTFLVSIRKNTNKFISSNNYIDFITESPIPKVVFNSNIDSTGWLWLNTYIKNATILGFNVEIANAVALNSYLDNTLIVIPT